MSLNLKDNSINIVEDDIKFDIKDILESDIDGNYFYAISKNNLLLSLKRTKEGIRLVDQYSIKTTAHTISDYENLILLCSAELPPDLPLIMFLGLGVCDFII